MLSNARISSVALLLGALLFLGACSTGHLEQPQVQGPPAMIEDAGKPRLWVLTKQEEVRQISVGGGGRRSSTSWRSDTFFHFNVQAFDPVAAKPLWTKRLVTIGDPEAKGREPSRVIGSAVGARMLGQEGNRVWLLVGDAPFAVSTADGSIVADSESLQQANPELKGLLPSEAKHYGFDSGLVVMAADARQFVVRGPEQKVVAYTPPPPVSAYPEGRLQANGTRELVPMLPLLGEPPARQVMLAGQWLGLYSDKEAADAAADEWGKKLRYPYTITDDGKLARRTFWRAKIVTAQRFDDRFERLSELTPIAGAPTFLKGRFKTDPRTGDPLLMEDPAGLLVWHSTRIDDAGRLALTRLDADLKPVWKAELPLSETDLIRRIATWIVPGHMVIVGEEQLHSAGVLSRESRLVSVDLKTGALRAWDFSKEEAVP